MSDRRTLGEDLFVAPAERDAAQIVRDASKQPLPRRFYKDVSVEERESGFAVLLDGRPVKTPKKHAFALPTRALADLAAGEWAGQGETLDPASMPLTRLANAALDGVAADIGAVAADVVKYAGSDLVCYRAGEPPALAAAQRAAWDPILAFARDSLGASFTLVEGIVFADQPPEAIAAVGAAVDEVASGDDAAVRIAALHVVTTLTGSALIALAVRKGALDAEAAWRAAHVDEDEQMRVWGLDAEALRRRAARFLDMRAACAVLREI